MIVVLVTTMMVAVAGSSLMTVAVATRFFAGEEGGQGQGRKEAKAEQSGVEEKIGGVQGNEVVAIGGEDCPRPGLFHKIG